MNKNLLVVENNNIVAIRNNRIHVFDSIIGLASLQVLIHHCLLLYIPISNFVLNNIAYKENYFLDTIILSPLHITWAGHEAVILFFVLSGFVLSIHFMSDSKIIYKQFFIKRLFRIYGPFVIILCVGIIFNHMFNTYPRKMGLSTWFNSIWSTNIDYRKLVELFFLFSNKYHNVVTSLWTIPIEIKISFIFPFLVMLMKSKGIEAWLILFFGNIIFYMIGKRLGFQSNWNDFSLFYYLTFFLAGGILSKFNKELMKTINKLNNKVFFILFFVAIYCYTYEWNTHYLPLWLKKITALFPTDYAVCAASLIFLLLSQSRKAFNFFSKSYMLFLGKISFSIYLVHPIVIGILGHYFFPILSVFIIIPLCIILSIMIAIPFYYIIEKPFSDLGKKLSMKFYPESTELIMPSAPVIIQ